MAEIDYINLTDWQARAGFSQAVVVSDGAKRIILSGVGSESSGQTEAVGDVAAQCRSAWASIAEVLQQAGATTADIVRVRTYVTDPRSLAAVTKERKAALGDPPYPPHTFLVVSALAQPDMLVEIEVEAVVGL